MPQKEHSGSVESSPGSLKKEDLSSSHAITVFKDKSQGALDQLSLILSPEHKISQKLYIPRRTATAALGACCVAGHIQELPALVPQCEKDRGLGGAHGALRLS